MTQQIEKDLQVFFEKEAESSLFSPFQQKAWTQFQSMGLPTRKNPAFKYIPLKDLYSKTFDFSPPQELHPNISALIYPECQNSFVTFLNGVFSPTLSNLTECEGLSLLSFDEASQKYQTFLHNRMTKAVASEEDPFALLNYAFSKRGAFIYISPKKEVIRPLQILLLTTHENSFVFPRLHLFGGKGSFINLLLSHDGQNKSITDALIDITLEEDAKINVNLIEQNALSSGLIFSCRATLKERSTLTSVAATAGASLSRHDYHISLLGEGAGCDISGAWVLKEKCQHHVRTFVHHRAEKTHSRQKFKGVLNDFSRSSFEGMIFVDSIAQKTEAYQVNNNLLLSEKAYAYTRPNLEVFADDVKASHGATIGQINGDQLFYLKARGIDEELAKMLLVRGFTQEVIEKISSPSCRQRAYTSLN